MVINNHKEKEKTKWKNIEEGIRTVGRIGLQDGTIHPEIRESTHPADVYKGDKVDWTEETSNENSVDLGPYYIARVIDAMEEWHSKPREGYHVTDAVMCPRQRVYREIDRLPIDAKTVSIYSAGKAIHEAVQLLFLSDKRTFEREKYGNSFLVREHDPGLGYGVVLLLSLEPLSLLWYKHTLNLVCLWFPRLGLLPLNALTVLITL